MDLGKRGFPIKETRLVEAATLDARPGGLTLDECHAHIAFLDIFQAARYLVPINHNLALTLVGQLLELMPDEDRAKVAAAAAGKET